MLNLYKTMAKNQAEKEEYTGHDRFYQPPHDLHISRRKKRSLHHNQRHEHERDLEPPVRTRSQPEMRSKPEEDSSSSQVVAASLAKLFPCVSAQGHDNGNHQEYNNRTQLHRHGGRYEYMALEAEGAGVGVGGGAGGSGSGQERMELERRAKAEADSACSLYLKACPRYTLVHHLNDIGSRVDKHWFIVRDSSVKTERLLTLVGANSWCPLKLDPQNRTTLLELFLNLQHPYIYPVLDLDFRKSPDNQQTYIVLVIPFNSKGSLKDLIYKSVWQDDWSDKYSQRSEGLPLSQVQRLGRQILEALLFLKERGFPTCSHLHSGNIIIQNGVARLSGLENVLFGFTSRIHPVISKHSPSDPTIDDIICFGHVLFEMCAGYELTVATPTAANLLDLDSYPQVIEVLEFIFQHPKHRYPSIEELLMHDFFRTIDLREMRATSLPAYHSRLTLSTLALLSEVKKHQKSRRCRRSHSTSTDEPPSPRIRRDHSDCSEDERGSDYEDDDEEMEEDEELTTSSREDSDSDQDYDSSNEHRNLSLHMNQQSLSPIRLDDDDLLR